MKRSSCAARNPASVLLNGNGCRIAIAFEDAPHVIPESRELADQYGIGCAECESRFEMSGEDPDMELFNDHLLINETLQATGSFVIFDPQEEKLLFE